MLHNDTTDHPTMNDRIIPLTFETFLRSHRLYNVAFEELTSASRLLAISAEMVYAVQGEALGPVADEILAFVDAGYPPNYIRRYIARCNKLAELQRVFENNPCTATLGSSDLVDPKDYGLSLLLSIVFTNHRFEITAALTSFLTSLSRQSTGTIASLGAGTGYELKQSRQLLPQWQIDAYDISGDMRAQAASLLAFFGIANITFNVTFPLESLTGELGNRYDAIIACEVLEHLPDPARALRSLRNTLRPGGKMFLTMAVNMAQEDHVFWYEDIPSCRRQIEESGLETIEEWISPQTIILPSTTREVEFRKGNYIAVVQRPKYANGG